MLIGYARVSKADGSQLLDIQVDAATDRIYEDRMSGRRVTTTTLYEYVNGDGSPKAATQPILRGSARP